MRYSAPNKRYFRCRKCGALFAVRVPTPGPGQGRAEGPGEAAAIECRECGIKAGEVLKNALGQPELAILEVTGHRAVSEWKKDYVLKYRVIPKNWSVGQYSKLSHMFLTNYLPKLRDRELKLIMVLQLYQDASSGWTWPLSIRVLSYMCAGPDRDSPLNPRTVRESIRSLQELKVNLQDKASGDFIPRPLLEVYGNDNEARKYKVNLP